ncbi:MAG: hypothetical protein ACXVBU_14515, partial [Ktedonobacteraceae bacterium]
MPPQTSKDEVQPGEKAPAGDENTTDAFLYPPQQKKSKPYMVWFKRAGVCVGVGLGSPSLRGNLSKTGWRKRAEGLPFVRRGFENQSSHGGPTLPKQHTTQ